MQRAGAIAQAGIDVLGNEVDAMRFEFLTPLLKTRFRGQQYKPRKKPLARASRPPVVE